VRVRTRQSGVTTSSVLRDLPQLALTLPPNPPFHSTVKVKVTPKQATQGLEGE
jgi:hypothetical protein